MAGTAPPRNVVYFSSKANQTPLPGIANLPYTDVIVAFLVPDGNLNLVGAGGAFDGNLKSNIQTLQRAGKNVLISFGGAIFPSSAYQNYARNVNGLVKQIVNFVTSNGFNGVDIDYEDSNAFTNTRTYDGIGFLISLTKSLAQSLPAGHNIITHAPQTPYWDPNAGYNNAYTKIWQQVGNQIAWINNQFYDNPDYDKDAATKVLWYQRVAAITGAQKLLVGALVANTGTDEGYITLDDMIQNVITPLKSKFGSQFGGVMGWEFALDQGGAWANRIGQALGAGSPHPPPTVDPEIVYLCNCYSSDGQKSSEMDYYPKTSLSQHGEPPAAIAVVATNGTVTWEGHPVVGTFPDGNHFTSNITDHNGPVGAVKGSGFNDERQFTCRQDSGRLLYSDGNKSCYSIYYCQ